MKAFKSVNTRCNLCSLGCFLSVARSAHGYMAPEYRHDVPPLRRGACNRGNMTPDLMEHVRRVLSARFTDVKKPADVPLEPAFGRIADEVRASGATLVIDGNLPCEDIAAGLALAAGSKGKIAPVVYLPAEDEAVLDGLAAANTKFMTPEELAGCDALLIVGDAFATHPVISKPVHDLRRRNPRLPLIVVDSLVGRTEIFANLPLLVKPGTESRVLGAMALGAGVSGLGAMAEDASKVAGAAGVSAEALSAAVRAVAGAKKLGVIVRAEIGKATDWDRVGLLAGLIAGAKGGGVAACLTYGNAMGACRLSHTAGAGPAPASETMIVLGTDIASVLSEGECAATMDRVKMLVAAGALPSPTTDAANVVLPMAFNFESGGTTVTGSGEIIAVDSIVDPPGDAKPAGELARILAEMLGIAGVERKVDAKRFEHMPLANAKAIIERVESLPAEPRLGEFAAVTHSDAIHFHTGSMTGLMAWPQWMAPAPTVLMNSADAEALGIEAGERVIVESSEGQGEAKAELAKGHARGVVAVSSGFAAMRGLFRWNSAHPTGPVAVKVRKLAP